MLSTGNFSELNVSGDAYIGGDLTVDQSIVFAQQNAQNLSVSGIATVSDLDAQYARVDTLSVTGFSSVSYLLADSIQGAELYLYDRLEGPALQSSYDYYSGISSNSMGDTYFYGEVDFSLANVRGLEGAAGPMGPAGATGFGIYATARTDAAGSMVYSVGIATVAIESIGTYRYILSQPLPGAQYSVMGQPLETTTDTNVMISEINDTGFLLKVGRGDNGKTDDTLINCPHCVTVFAGW